MSNEKMSRWILRTSVSLPILINVIVLFTLTVLFTWDFDSVLIGLSIWQYIYGLPLVIYFYKKKKKSWYVGLLIGLIAFNIVTIFFYLIG